MKIRKFEDSDLEDLYSTLSDPEVMKYIEDPYSMEQVKEFLADVGTCDDPRVFAAEDDAGNYVGYVIYHEYDDDSMELGWLLNKSEWGKGYACRLTELMVEMACKAGKDAVIECDPEQIVTKHIAGKYGFTYEGEDDGCDVFRLRG